MRIYGTDLYSRIMEKVSAVVKGALLESSGDGGRFRERVVASYLERLEPLLDECRDCAGDMDEVRRCVVRIKEWRVWCAHALADVVDYAAAPGATGRAAADLRKLDSERRVPCYFYAKNESRPDGWNYGGVRSLVASAAADMLPRLRFYAKRRDWLSVSDVVSGDVPTLCNAIGRMLDKD